MVKKMGDPDRGPPMMEGAHSWDKGYESDEGEFSPNVSFPADQERGNKYFDMRNAAAKSDGKKLERSKFSKYA